MSIAAIFTAITAVHKAFTERHHTENRTSQPSAMSGPIEENYVDIRPQTPSPLLGLQCLVHAIYAFKRGGFKEEAKQFSDFVICNFEQDDYMRAFNAEQLQIPKKTTAEADFQYADQMLKEVDEELVSETKAKKVGNDIRELYAEEIKAYLERKKRREKEKKEAEEAEEEAKLNT